MPNPLDEKLARFEELERQLVDPETSGQSGPADGRGARARLAGQAGHEVPPLQESQRPNPRSPGDAQGARPRHARAGRGRARPTQGRAGNALERAARHDHRRRGRQPHPLHPGNPRRHRRRGGGPVRPRPLRNVQALRRGQPLEGRSPRHVADRVGRVQGDHPGHRRRRGLSASCNSRAAAIACSACPKPRPRAASTPPPPPWP